MTPTMLALFPDRATAERAVGVLQAAHFDQSQLGLLMRAHHGLDFPAPEKPANAAKGAATGAVTGGIGGTILATLGTVIIPGIGPFLAGGVLVTALTGAGGGALFGALIGQNVPNFHAQQFQRRIEEGSVLVLVDAQGREHEARQILQQAGARELRDDFDIGTELRRHSQQSITSVHPAETLQTPSQGLADAKTFLAARQAQTNGPTTGTSEMEPDHPTDLSSAESSQPMVGE